MGGTGPKIIFFRGEGEPKRPGTDLMTSGPITGIKKLNSMAQTSRHLDMATLSLNGPSGAESVKSAHYKMFSRFFCIIGLKLGQWRVR